ncbi:MAG: DUF6398 domain-containing protein [Nitrospirota bacterium]
MIDKLHAARKRFIANRGLLDEYLRKLEGGAEPIDRKILLAIKAIEFSRWVYLRDLKGHSIFLKDNGEHGYGVLGLTDEISAQTGGPGAVLEAGVFAFDEHYICDGLIATLARLGPNIRKSCNEQYKELRETGRFLVNPLLPPALLSERHKSQGTVNRRSDPGSGPDARKQTRIEEVTALLNAFSEAHLSPQLSGYVRDLWGLIGRKRKYVITGGAKEVWAAAVVYVIARLNFLFDSNSRNHLTADMISAFFGTKKTTMSARAADIEKACKIRMGQEGLCEPGIADMLTFVKLPNGMVIPKKMAQEAGLI